METAEALVPLVAKHVPVSKEWGDGRKSTRSAGERLGVLLVMMVVLVLQTTTLGVERKRERKRRKEILSEVMHV